MNRERKIKVEEVESVATPKRARVTPEFERKKDYLAGFIAGEAPEELKGGPGSDLQAEVVNALKSIYDPEIPVDIYELGLIYDVAISEDGDAVVTMWVVPDRRFERWHDLQRSGTASPPPR